MKGLAYFQNNCPSNPVSPPGKFGAILVEKIKADAKKLIFCIEEKCFSIQKITVNDIPSGLLWFLTKACSALSTTSATLNMIA
jgi:hypothetical protein